MSVSIKRTGRVPPLAMVVVRPAKLFDIPPDVVRIERASFREEYPRGVFLVFLETTRTPFSWRSTTERSSVT